ncbi:MAG: N-acetylmuramic acid 6-phosphate etherase [Clostridium baratii]|uniref:N-acetylmuramic acid 6-phosphate etherase n=1 Tax=Clostridium baratii TaxID=1561 RepID=UPI00242B2BC1|nr:N-acetylmuramic acid 6-phosphate etherase [Clostridium baratii]MBS6041491.1 N-acetylmuramic acid 6-phosphate etherase [Clostridium baratii]
MQVNLIKLETEKRNYDTKNIDKLTTKGVVKLINNEDKKVALVVEKALSNIANAVDLVYEQIKLGGRLIYIGAGTSGRLGILDAAECPPTYGINFDLVQGIIAGGKEAIFKAKEGAEDSQELAVEDLKSVGFNNKDVLIGIAASGRTPYVIGALKYAKKIDAKTVSLCCVKSGEISKYSDIAIEVVTGPEVITGSTRMKAGTAQKMVLNMISTGVMIKCGKVYGNLMIDLKPTNEKLVERSKKIIMEAVGCSREIAEEFFIKSNENVKLAIFMILSGLEKNDAIEILEKNEGKISKAIDFI